MKKIELNYYDEFIKNADYALEISMILKDYIEHFDYNKSEQTENNVHQLENDADKNLHKILNYLITDFIPPIEREDIVALSHRIDDVIDSIDEVVINLDILNVIYLRNDFKAFADLIYQGCFDLKQMMLNFKNLKEYDETRKMVVSINKLEESGDKLYQQAIKNLYTSETNVIEIQKWHTIYNCVETCFDALENVANCVEEIILKNT